MAREPCQKDSLWRPKGVPRAPPSPLGASQERPSTSREGPGSVPRGSWTLSRASQEAPGSHWNGQKPSQGHFGLILVEKCIILDGILSRISKGWGVFFCYGRLGHSTSICNLLALPVQTFDATGQCNTPTTSPTRACQHSRCLPPSPT